MFSPTKNPTDSEVRGIIAASKHKAARRVTDPRNGDQWYWPAEQATHAEGAGHLGVPYDRPPGAGDIITDD
jgi:hypothetical protein